MFRVWRFAGIENSVVFITFYEHAKTHKASCKKIQAIYFKICALYFEISALYFCYLKYLINNKFCVLAKKRGNCLILIALWKVCL